MMTSPVGKLGEGMTSKAFRPPFDFVVFCPHCEKKTFCVRVEESGESFDDCSGQQFHWFRGKGECTSCGFLGDYSDSTL
jgi:hypothetical protein